MRRSCAAVAATLVWLTVACGHAGPLPPTGQAASITRTAPSSAPTADQVASPGRWNAPPPPGTQAACTAKPNGLPLAYVWPVRPEVALVVDLSDITNPRTICTLTNIYPLARFYSAVEISYVFPRFESSVFGGYSLVRTNVTTNVTETFL